MSTSPTTSFGIAGAGEEVYSSSEGYKNRLTSPSILGGVSASSGIVLGGEGEGAKGEQMMKVSLSVDVRQESWLEYSSSRDKGSLAVASWIS